MTDVCKLRHYKLAGPVKASLRVVGQEKGLVMKRGKGYGWIRDQERRQDRETVKVPAGRLARGSCS